MTEKAQGKAAAEAPPQQAAFRRSAALAILGGFITRHGGFGADREQREIHMLQVWQLADSFLATEHTAPPPEPEPVPPPPSRRGGRPAHPTDEWAVREGDRQRRGFVSREEADAYASGRPGAQVVQVGGPEVAHVLTAPASVD